MGKDFVGGKTAVVFEKGTASGGYGGDVFGIPRDFGGAISLALALKDTRAMISSPFCRHDLVLRSWDLNGRKVDSCI